MNVTALTPVGALVDDVRVDELDGPTVHLLQQALGEHGVVIMREQYADDTRFLRFLRSFGELMFTTGETPVPGFDDLNVISNVGRTTPPRSTFHVDTSYVRIPPAYTALRAVEVPESGGQTLFSNQYRAYDTLPEDMRLDLADRTVEHVVTGLDLGDDDETSAVHPLFRVHPVTGRTALFLTTPKRCASVSGMSSEQAEELVRWLFEHSTREDNVTRHAWAPGDVVMWDNRCVMHQADHSGVVGDRVMHRGMVADVA
ncbi:TauD/TfdA dioxygenase family protein [Mycolicibacterium sediminis]|uniref:Alpha-ketoglutarate-dependent taurine dioxygenase n=1 Tax=Mycolicibacterium sediminis TaxID=1286180 RepID=A0A7I7QR25_9MYCO|nr:TauD/TfdA family dioxygenase [Mycolicibacterium sediminis]BBY28662.1 alpha-ketoglutarate-dependent taurine dioxygenase [Mycolicibacterium sediminis]